MASAFSHILIPAVFYTLFRKNGVNFKLFFVTAVLSVLPDIDVIGYAYGIPYESQWGHRGFTHSLSFAFAVAVFISLFYRQLEARPWIVFVCSFIACASHAFLDAMTNGGLGVALFWPFSPERIFMPYRPLVVPPIGIGSFFSEWGMRVLASELIWIFMPAFLLIVSGVVLRWIVLRRH